jgi:hypothetical protein
MKYLWCQPNRPDWCPLVLESEDKNAYDEQ